MRLKASALALMLAASPLFAAGTTTPTPSITIFGPSTIYEGQSAFFYRLLTGKPPVGVPGKWLNLPAGSRASETYATFTYTAGSTPAASAFDVAYSYPDTGINSKAKAVTLVPYSTPDIVIRPAQTVGYAPFTTTFSVTSVPGTPVSFSNIAAFKYQWQCSENVQCVPSANGNSVRVTAISPGVIAATVTGTDSRGKTRTASIDGIKVYPDIPTATLDIMWGQRYQHAPASLMLRPSVTHLPKGDKVVSSSLEFAQAAGGVAGSPIATFNGPATPKSVLVQTPGTHSFKYTFTTDKGVTTSVLSSIVVPENNPPELVTLTPTFAKDGKSVSLYASAKDTDGYVKAYSWTINGKTLTTAGQFANYLFGPGETNQYASVVLRVTDDSGGVSTYSREFFRQ